MDGVVMTLIDAVRAQFNIDENRIIVTGFSFGGIGTWHYAGEHADLFTAAIPIASRISEEYLAEIEDISIYVIQSTADEEVSYTDMASRVTALQAQGIDVTLKTAKGLSHYDTPSFTKPLKTAIPWLRERW